MPIRSWLFAVSCVMAGMLKCDVASGAPAQFRRVLFPAGPTRLWVRLAVEGAARRLTDPRCQDVLSDFADAEGRTLVEVLTTLGQTPSQYVRNVWFVDGRDQSQCRDTEIGAVTMTGGRVIFLCPHLFHLQPGSKHNEILVIHELLHTLGLGENPPTSERITEQVTKRCGGV